MPNWNRIIVGDAFKVQPGGFNYYRDVFLTWPFLGFSIAAVSNLVGPQSATHRIFGLKLAICAAVALILAKERIMLVLVASAYVAVRMVIAIAFFSYLVNTSVAARLWRYAGHHFSVRRA
jgi:hypothetical protein